jgi:CheY-like chemotaxis protein
MAVRILYLDDEQGNLDTFSGALVDLARKQGMDLTVDKARSIAQAEGLVAKNTYDALVVDYCLEHGDSAKTGIDFIRHVRERKLDTPVIVFSAVNHKDIRAKHPEADALCIADYCPKRPSILLTSLGYALPSPAKDGSPGR